jgi:hypothetical protein
MLTASDEFLLAGPYHGASTNDHNPSGGQSGSWAELRLVYQKRSAAMSIRLSYLTPFLAAAGAAAAAVAIVVAPAASADPATDPGPAQSCASLGTDTQCESPGNVQINDSPGPVQYMPQYPYWEGGSFGRGGHGGHR